MKTNFTALNAAILTFFVKDYGMLEVLLELKSVETIILNSKKLPNCQSEF